MCFFWYNVQRTLPQNPDRLGQGAKCPFPARLTCDLTYFAFSVVKRHYHQDSLSSQQFEAKLIPHGAKHLGACCKCYRVYCWLRWGSPVPKMQHRMSD